MNNYAIHYEETSLIPEALTKVFNYVDDHTNFSSHMSGSSWMMGGGKMDISIDKDMGKKVGSHILLKGTAFGLKLNLDEVITKHHFPTEKTWKTVGTPKLLVIGDYGMGLKIKPKDNKSLLTVFIDYNLPKTNKWLGILFSDLYAKWCVKQMIKGTGIYFGTKNTNKKYA